MEVDNRIEVVRADPEAATARANDSRTAARGIRQPLDRFFPNAGGPARLAACPEDRLSMSVKTTSLILPQAQENGPAAP